MNKCILSFCLFFILSFGMKAQNIPYGAYVNHAGYNGAPSLRYQFSDNALYAASSRFNVTYTATESVYPPGLFDGGFEGTSCLMTPNKTVTLNIDFTAKGNYGVVYPGGKVLLHFSYLSVPQTVSGRMQKTDGTWFDITNWTNISTLSGRAIYEGTVSASYVNIKAMEITITSPPTTNTSLVEVEYIIDRSLFESGLVTKFTNQTLYRNFLWKNDNADTVAYIKNDGGVYFKSWLGINTPSPQSTLHVTGTAQITGNTKLGSLTITNNALNGRVLTCDANGLGIWKDLPAGSGGGWGLNGSSVSAITNLGTTSNYDLPIITNNIERMRISKDGSIGIGTATIGTGYKLYVAGNIRARKVRVDNDTWPDYVFAPEYNLMPLSELDAFIKKNKHLPGIPNAAEVKKEGIDLGSNQADLLKKIEELTLYVIEQQKNLEKQQQQLLLQQQKIEALEKSLPAKQ